jgi:xylan 1,4-beta-xylosidase
VFNTFELFARLPATRLRVEAPSMLPVDRIITASVRGEPDIGAVATIDDARERLAILLWNYHDVAGYPAQGRAVQLSISGLGGAAGALAIERSIDEKSGNAYTAWQQMGSPQEPTAAQVALLHAAATMRPVTREVRHTSSGDIRLQIELTSQSVKLIEIPLRPATSTGR